jgi:hypothetical protein
VFVLYLNQRFLYILKKEKRDGVKGKGGVKERDVDRRVMRLQR